MDILYILIGLIIGGIGIYLILKPKLKIISYNNEEILNEIEKLNKTISDKQETLDILSQQTQQENQKHHMLLQQNKEVRDELLQLKEVQTRAAEDYYNQALNIAENNFEKEIDRISDTLFEKREEAKNIYLQTMEETTKEFEEAIEEKQKEFSYWNHRIISLQADVQTALKAAQRKMEMETLQDYYRICLSNEDINEIKKLREVLPFLRDKTPLNKVIYKVYYEKPLTDMIGRVVGSGVHTGIYKITNIENQMCYIGQAVDIASRWKQHTKRGVGAEDWTQNKLYPAMYSIGVENFTFEIVEECDRNELNKREDYWQNYFHAKDFGYSIK